MARVIRDEQKGQYLRTTSNLSSVELSELHALAPEAHDAFSIEMRDAVEHLRELLTVDPLYVLSIVAMANQFGGWGTYYEPTHEGSELKVEVVAGLLVTQPAGAEAYKAPSSEHISSPCSERPELCIGCCCAAVLSATTGASSPKPSTARTTHGSPPRTASRSATSSTSGTWSWR